MHKIDPMAPSVLFCRVLRKCRRPVTDRLPRWPESFRLRQQLPEPARAEWNFQNFDAARRKIERILDRLREQRADWDGTRLAGALDAERIERRHRHGVAE